MVGADYTGVALGIESVFDPEISDPHIGCNAFDKAAALSRAAGQKRRAGAVGGRAKVTKRMQLGNSELTRLWNMGGNSLEAISSTKQTVPTLTVCSWQFCSHCLRCSFF